MAKLNIQKTTPAGLSGGRQGGPPPAAAPRAPGPAARPACARGPPARPCPAARSPPGPGASPRGRPSLRPARPAGAAGGASAGLWVPPPGPWPARARRPRRASHVTRPPSRSGAGRAVRAAGAGEGRAPPRVLDSSTQAAPWPVRALPARAWRSSSPPPCPRIGPSRAGLRWEGRWVVMGRGGRERGSEELLRAL